MSDVDDRRISREHEDADADQARRRQAGWFRNHGQPLAAVQAHDRELVRLFPGLFD